MVCERGPAGGANEGRSRPRGFIIEGFDLLYSGETQVILLLIPVDGQASCWENLGPLGIGVF